MRVQPRPSLSLRAIEIDGEPWFHAKDIGRALLYSNTAEAIRVHVDAEDKQSVSLGLPGRAPILVNESGMYSLIMASKQAQAREYKRWVTKEVMPAICRNGGHMKPEVAQAAIDDPAVFMAKALVIANG